MKPARHLLTHRRFQFQQSTPIERVFQRVRTPFEQFIHDESAGGLLLMGCAIIALIIANSPLLHAYEHLLNTAIGIDIGGIRIEHSLHHWINDGLMALFFFVVGLEIKREILVGELSKLRRAALPILGAIGGMVAPALLYMHFNPEGPARAGWGIPMATDIAFAVGVMVLLGKRVPPALFTFLVALAIVDDLGAVAVIALFYTANLDLTALAAACGLVGLLVLLNAAGVRGAFAYYIIGILTWLAMSKSGVHATIAGVLVAWTIPAKSKFSPAKFADLVQNLMRRYQTHCVGVGGKPSDIVTDLQQRRAIVSTLRRGLYLMETPLQRLEQNWHIPVAFLVLPLFALANAGVPIDTGKLGDTLSGGVGLGIVTGLVVGKIAGIAGIAFLAIKLKIAELPTGATMQHVIGVSMLGGIGFTMSIFIAELGFRSHPDLLLEAKIGILAASLIAGTLGALILIKAPKPEPAATHADSA